MREVANQPEGPLTRHRAELAAGLPELSHQTRASG